MTTFRNLRQAMNALADAIDDEQERVVKATATRALRAAVRRTPKDEGLARSGWFVSTGRPVRRKPISPLRSGTVYGLGERGNATAAINRGKQIIDRLRVRGGRVDVFITNNVDYIEDLDNGSSAQAPAGFSDHAAAEALKEAKRFRIKLDR